MASFVVFSTRGFPQFEPLAMLGGFLWCTGNIMVVPIIRCIGLSMGMLIWGLVNLLMGWCSGTFGLFGLHKEEVKNPGLNYAGAAIAVLSVFAFAFVKPTVRRKTEEDDIALINEKPEPTGFDLDSLSDTKKRIVGIGLSVISGLLYGTNFNPPQYLIDNCDTCSKVGLDYVFPHFCGIYITSTFYFLVYCIVKGNQPWVPPPVAFPAYISGLLWALADISWFVANSTLALVVSFPTISITPGVVASLWGIIVFKEIQGRNNYIFFGIGFLLVAVSITCTVLSQVDLH
uniref:EamA domain-containing protein n=1 Tax=Arcella intermedia TaxID=1963864 RepID=A0A6B2LA77_9EUKA